MKDKVEERLCVCVCVSSVSAAAAVCNTHPPNDWDNIWGVEYLNWLIAVGREEGEIAVKCLAEEVQRSERGGSKKR